jgi:hypothetical protein
MKRTKSVVAAFVVGWCAMTSVSVAQTPAGKNPATLAEALEEIKALKARLGQLETVVTTLAQTNPPPARSGCPKRGA